MGYHWGRLRPPGTDRRVARGAVHAPPQFSGDAPRQHPKEKKSVLGWVVLGLVGFVMLDLLAWDGYYLHAMIASVNRDAAATRAWSDNIWHFS